MINKEDLINKIKSGERISAEEGASLFEWDIVELGALADLRRKIIYPEETAGFIIDRIINYTNVCEAQCRFCAYHSRAGRLEPYELKIDEILEKIDQLKSIGGLQVMLQGGLHPDATLEFYVGLVSAVKKRFPDIYLHSFSPSEIVHISAKSGLSYVEILKRLKDAGLDSIPGASDLLVERIRNIVSPKKSTTEQWCNVMRALKANGMGSTATMTYGLGETDAEKIEHMDVIRSIQDETGIIRAFIPWSFSPKNTDMEHIVPATGVDYLRVVAIARIYLDNVKYIQAGWLTEGLKLAQVALAMGANDMGGVLMEEVVVKATGVETATNMNELIEIIKNSGKEPVLRDSEYRIVQRF